MAILRSSKKAWIILSALILALAFAGASFLKKTPTPENSVASVSEPPQPVVIGDRIYLAAESDSGQPATEVETSFECTEPIYAVMESTQIAHGKHQFQVLFIDPDGKERERVEYEFIARGQDRIWGWLRLHRGTGGTLFSVFDSAAGMEDLIGDWTAKFHLDGELLQQQNFDVLC